MFDLVKSLFDLAAMVPEGRERELYLLISAIIAEVEVARLNGVAPAGLVRPSREELVRLFPGLGMYWSLLTPLDMYGEQEPTVGDAVDDLMSILSDLESGVALGNEAQTLANWRASFRDHWGQHALGLQVALGAQLVAGTLPTTSTKS